MDPGSWNQRERFFSLKGSPGWMDGWMVKTRGTRTPALAVGWAMTIYFPV